MPYWLMILMVHLNIMQTAPFVPNVTAHRIHSDMVGEPFKSYYQNFGGSSTEGNLVNFYETFTNYMKSTNQVLHYFSSIWTFFAFIFWCIARGLEAVYYRLFQLFNFESLPGGLGRLYNDVVDFGTGVFVFMLVLYVIGSFFSTPNYRRYKVIMINLLLVGAFTACAPSVSRILGRGITSIATHSSLSNRHGDSYANLIFKDNVVSIPHHMMQIKPNQRMYPSGDNKQFTPIKGEGMKGVNVSPVQINLDAMSDAERNSWNGLDDMTVPQFLNSYTDSTDVMNRDVLKMYTKRYNKKNYHWYNFIKKSQSRRAFKGIFENYLTSSDNGPEVNEMDEFTKGTSWIPAFRISYNYYHVDWFAVLSELFMMVVIMAVFIYKLFVIFYKIIFMSVTSGFVLSIHGTNQGKVKSWILSWFSLYEILVIDMICIFITIALLPAIRTQLTRVFINHAGDLGMGADHLIIDITNIIADFALFKVANHGLSSVDAMVGPAGGGANSGGSKLMDFMMLRSAARGATHSIADITGTRGAMRKFNSRNANKPGKAGPLGAGASVIDGLRANKGDISAKNAPISSTQPLGNNNNSIGTGQRKTNKTPGIVPASGQLNEDAKFPNQSRTNGQRTTNGARTANGRRMNMANRNATANNNKGNTNSSVLGNNKNGSNNRNARNGGANGIYAFGNAKPSASNKSTSTASNAKSGKNFPTSAEENSMLKNGSAPDFRQSMNKLTGAPNANGSAHTTNGTNTGSDNSSNVNADNNTSSNVDNANNNASTQPTDNSADSTNSNSNDDGYANTFNADNLSSNSTTPSDVADNNDVSGENDNDTNPLDNNNSDNIPSDDTTGAVPSDDTGANGNDGQNAFVDAGNATPNNDKGASAQAKADEKANAVGTAEQAGIRQGIHDLGHNQNNNNGQSPVTPGNNPSNRTDASNNPLGTNPSKKVPPKKSGNGSANDIKRAQQNMSNHSHGKQTSLGNDADNIHRSQTPGLKNHNNNTHATNPSNSGMTKTGNGGYVFTGNHNQTPQNASSASVNHAEASSTNIPSSSKAPSSKSAGPTPFTPFKNGNIAGDDNSHNDIDGNPIKGNNKNARTESGAPLNDDNIPSQQTADDKGKGYSTTDNGDTGSGVGTNDRARVVNDDNATTSNHANVLGDNSPQAFNADSQPSDVGNGANSTDTGTDNSTIPSDDTQGTQPDVGSTDTGSTDNGSAPVTDDSNNVGGFDASNPGAVGTDIPSFAHNGPRYMSGTTPDTGATPHTNNFVSSNNAPHTATGGNSTNPSPSVSQPKNSPVSNNAPHVNNTPHVSRTNGSARVSHASANSPVTTGANAKRNVNRGSAPINSKPNTHTTVGTNNRVGSTSTQSNPAKPHYMFGGNGAQWNQAHGNVAQPHYMFSGNKTPNNMTTGNINNNTVPNNSGNTNPTSPINNSSTTGYTPSNNGSVNTGTTNGYTPSSTITGANNTGYTPNGTTSNTTGYAPSNNMTGANTGNGTVTNDTGYSPNGNRTVNTESRQDVNDSPVGGGSTTTTEDVDDGSNPVSTGTGTNVGTNNAPRQSAPINNQQPTTNYSNNNGNGSSYQNYTQPSYNQSGNRPSYTQPSNYRPSNYGNGSNFNVNGTQPSYNYGSTNNYGNNQSTRPVTHYVNNNNGVGYRPNNSTMTNGNNARRGGTTVVHHVTKVVHHRNQKPWNFKHKRIHSSKPYHFRNMNNRSNKKGNPLE